MATRPLRILYSLNGSSQYILARSQGAVPVELIPSPESPATTEGASSSRSVAPPPAAYASASLKTCLNTICRSSPEIIQDPSRDFSVYLLDPLETDCAPAQVNMSHSAPQPATAEAPEARVGAGVAVGLGLMSWAMMTEETDAMPVTGTLKMSGGKEMLEVIFSLRETIPMQQAALPEALRSWSLTSTSSKTQGKKPVPYPSRKAPRTAATPITESDKFLAAASIYVGPERRPPGNRPRNRPLTPEEGEDDEEEDVVVVEPPPRHNNPGKDPSPTEPSPLLDFLALLKIISPEIERNKALGNVLGLVHGSSGTEQHPPAELATAVALFSDLQRASQSSHRSQPESTSFSHNQHRRKSSSTDDEIVVLNKENVNPKVFRRRAERGKALDAVEPATAPTASSSGIPSRSASQIRLGPPEHQPSGRKRTLSEFMAEQESTREKEKTVKKAQYYRQPERSMSQDSLMFHNTATASATDTPDPVQKPKPSRKRTISCTSSPGTGGFLRSSGPPRPATSASSPVRPGRKPYILPDWARTDTATQPRLSDRVALTAQQKEEEEEAKKKEEAQKRKDTKKRQRDAKNSLTEGIRRKRPSTAATAAAQSAPSQATKPGAFPLPAPVAASGEFPVLFNNEQSSRPPFAPLPFGSPSRSALQTTVPPCTPPRLRRANTIATPGGPVSLFTPGPSSLFTPGSRAWQAGSVLAFGRRSMSPSSPKRCTADGQPNEEPEAEPEDDDLLTQQLDSAFDELDFPPSSLPVASSDIDVDVERERMPSSSQEYDSDDSDDDDAPPKQHWVGLPPSSPPPLSSPYLEATPMDDNDVDESPLPTSDGYLGSEQETLESPETEVINYSLEEINKLLDAGDLPNLFTSPTDPTSLFDQFSGPNFDVPSDSSQAAEGWGLDVTDADLDFNEFWESVRPLVEGGLQSNGGQPGESGVVDHDKLAGDVHALFSGCLV
ncbi:hypothetical protein C8R47DRAFT_1116055 [Mycena vitilis]|nr:hypothetical protein C8R47DRAFT_1116055 [Mycena vitilis]